MEPIKFADLPAFKVMGLKYRGDNAHQEISQLWGELNKRAKEIPIKGEYAYGVCSMLKDAPPGQMEYVAGFKVENYEKIPEGMVVADVPANHYAVFAHHGSLETLKATYEHIVHWLHRAALTPQSGYDLEVYTEEFKDFAPDSVYYIYEPTK